MSQIMVKDQIMDFVLTVSFMIVAYVMAKIANRWNPKIREIAGVAAIPEAIGRATELGRPVHFTTGIGTASLSKTEDGPMIVAGLSVFSHVTQLCAKNGVRLITSVGQ